MKLRTEGMIAARVVLLSLALTAAGTGSAAPPDDGWKMFRGDPQLTGVARGELARDLAPRWTFVAGDGFESTAAIHGRTVFVASLDGILYALDLGTGEVRWKYDAGEEIKSSPSWWDGTVYFGDEAGIFHALDAETGKPRWTFETDAGIISSANFSGDRVLFGSYDNNLYCLETSDGSLAWKVETAGYVHATPAVVEFDGNPAVASTGCDGFLRLVRVSDGSEVRRVEMGGYVAASPAIRGNRAFVGTFENQVLGIDLAAGTVSWTYEDPDRHFPFYASAALAADLVVIGGRDKQVHALRAATGKLVWKHASRARFDASPVILGDRVFVATTAGEITALDLHTGKPGWTFETGSAFLASPSIAGGMLVIGDADGTLYAFGGKVPASAVDSR